MSVEKLKEVQKLVEEKEEEIKKLTKLLEQKNLEHEIQLQDNRDYYENILAIMPGHVYWMSADNIYLGCNNLQARDARLKSRKDIVGKTNFDLPWKDQAEEFDKVNKEVMETGETNTREEYAVMTDGLAIYHTEKTPLRDKEGKIIGLVGVSLDITERKKNAAALRRAKEASEATNYAKTEFITNMSHDIKTPLTGIVGMAELLEAGAKTAEERQYARWINESGQQLLELLNRVLEIVSVGSLEKESEVINSAPYNLRKSIHNIARLVLPTVKMKNLDLRIEIDEAVPQLVFTDGTKLRRILLNLLGNAIKFTESGFVGINVQLLEDDEDYVQLQFNIFDTGIGIEFEVQPKVFERFFRINPTPGQGGHGVGLHIAQNYVGLLGGEINLTSKLGEGSLFSFVLSLKVAKQAEDVHLAEVFENKIASTFALEKEIDTRNQLSVSAEAPFLLLVEDNKIALRLVEIVATQAGCKFISTTVGEQALDLAKSMEFDLILTDINLPRMSGTQLTQEIRSWEKENRRRRQVPIVGLTVDAPGKAEEECLRSGMNEVLAKPITLIAMQKIVRHYISAVKKRT